MQQPQQRNQQPAGDRWNSIKSTRWVEEQERRAYGKGEYTFGLSEARRVVGVMQQQHSRRHHKTGSAYDWAAVAVLDDVLKVLGEMEQRAVKAQQYELWLYQQEMERVTTQELPTIKVVEAIVEEASEA